MNDFNNDNVTYVLDEVDNGVLRVDRQSLDVINEDLLLLTLDGTA